MSFSAENQRKLAGVLPVFQTPYHADETFDVETLGRQFDWLYDNGADGVVLAMVSEVLRLGSEERDELTTHTCRLARKRGVVVISVGAESSRVAERHARHAEAAGADGVMAIPPVSIGVGESELRKYFERILKAIKIPVIVQDASGYVGRPMPVEFQAGLFNEYGHRVMFKPEATPIGPRLTALRDATAGKASVFEGTGGIALVDSFRRGIVGTMPGADLIKAIVALWRALVAGDDRRAYQVWLPLGALVGMQNSLDAFLSIEKYLLVKQGVFKNTLVRGPVAYTTDEATRAEVDRLFDLIIRAVEGK
ncbi:MAG: dihydrodipicolinate synthase family protein [Tepidisphaeraceae bacterium]